MEYNCAMIVCLSVCLSARISQKQRPKFATKFSVHVVHETVTMARSSSGGVIVHYYTSGFVDDVVFSPNGHTVRHVYY